MATSDFGSGRLPSPIAIRCSECRAVSKSPRSAVVLGTQSTSLPPSGEFISTTEVRSAASLFSAGSFYPETTSCSPVKVAAERIAVVRAKSESTIAVLSLVRLSKTGVANEMRIEHTRRGAWRGSSAGKRDQAQRSARFGQRVVYRGLRVVHRGFDTCDKEGKSALETLNIAEALT